MFHPPPLDTRKWRWSDVDALYEIRCGNIEIEIYCKKEIVQSVYDVEDVNEMN